MSSVQLEGRRHAILTRNPTCGHEVPANESTSEASKSCVMVVVKIVWTIVNVIQSMLNQ